MRRLLFSFVFLLSCFFALGGDVVAQGADIIKTHIPKTIQIPSWILQQRDFHPFSFNISARKELLYPWNPGFLIVRSSDNPAFLPVHFSGINRDEFGVKEFFFTTEKGKRVLVECFDSKSGFTAGFKRGGLYELGRREIGIRINDDLFGVTQESSAIGGLSFHTPQWLYGDIEAGFRGSPTTFRYARKLSPHLSFGVGILGHSPNYLWVGNNSGGLLSGLSETSGQELGILYDTCSGVRFGVRVARLSQHGSIFIGTHAVTGTEPYRLAERALDFADSKINELSNTQQVDAWLTSAQNQFSQNIGKVVSDPVLRDMYQKQFNSWVTHERAGNFSDVTRVQNEARSYVTGLRSDLDKIAKPHLFSVSSELRTATLDMEWDISHNTTLFADYQMGKLRGVGMFENGSCGIRHQFDDHWNAAVSFHGGVSPKIDLGYQNKDLSVGVTYWHPSFEMLNRAVGSSSVFQVNASLRF